MAKYSGCVACVRSHSPCLRPVSPFAGLSGVGITLCTSTEKHLTTARPEEVRFGVSGIIFRSEAIPEHSAVEASSVRPEA